MNKLKEILFSKPQNDIANSTCDYNLFLAGVGSGKTHEMGILSAKNVTNFPEARGLICANTYGQLSKSTLSGVFKVWQEYFGLIEDVHYVVDKKPPVHFSKKGTRLKDYKNTITFINGAIIWVASLDNYTAIDGIEVSYALLDETKDSKEVAIKEVIININNNNVFFANIKVLCYIKPERRITIVLATNMFAINIDS